jgi:hypothetical protein
LLYPARHVEILHAMSKRFWMFLAPATLCGVISVGKLQENPLFTLECRLQTINLAAAFTLDEKGLAEFSLAEFSSAGARVKVRWRAGAVCFPDPSSRRPFNK